MNEPRKQPDLARITAEINTGAPESRSETFRTAWNDLRKGFQQRELWLALGWQDIKQRYASASFVGRNRVVFNIKGNDYRLIVAIAYRFQAIYIKFVGTHAAYDRIDAATVEDA